MVQFQLSSARFEAHNKMKYEQSEPGTIFIGKQIDTIIE